MPREKKTEIITLRVTPRTKAVIQARAKSVNKTVTDYLCLCGLGKEIVQVEGLDKVLSEPVSYTHLLLQNRCERLW